MKIENPFVKIVVRITSTYLESVTRDDDSDVYIRSSLERTLDDLNERWDKEREREKDPSLSLSLFFSERARDLIHLEPRTHVSTRFAHAYIRRRRVNWTYTYYMHYFCIASFLFTITRIRNC